MSNDGVLRNLRRQHELRVLTTLAERGPCSRRELEIATALSRTTMSAIVADLVRRRAVVDDAQRPASGRGRPTTLVRLNPRAASAVGVELGRGHVSVAVVDIARTVLAHATEPVAGGDGLPARMDAALALLDRVTSEGGLVIDGLRGAGLGLWGHHPDPRAGAEPSGGPVGEEPDGDPVLAESADGSSVAGPDSDPVVAGLVGRLYGALGAPVVWDHNIRLAAVAERHATQAPACADLVYVALSHGVGSGVLVNGTPARGASGTAGELGHVSVEPEGPPCWCGGRGCLERYLSVDAVLRRAGEVAPEVADIAGLVAALDRGDRPVREVVDRSAELLCRALSMVVTLLDPREVVIGGELAELGEHLLGPVRASLARRRLSTRDRRLDLRTARVAQGAAAVGAALIALNEYASIHDLDDQAVPAPASDGAVASAAADLCSGS
ncbi:ROK family protein [Microtetraspora sp. NBRC 16547]|uniref:ROK family transcriptional regulator n=1 Tax=Microtetraspora sp. NBRC 16547 TaxID=3030993 RepID=UPI0024A39992|nr:ROK family protein [Microtetraspora sp. NBRC 16547]GLX00586.1 transcriptional regulator [Microtetraspora sp. NBRC 16547]